jgi:signal transduction histidine kinase
VLDALANTLRWTFDVTRACDGAAGLRALTDQGPFTVVVSDFQMPGMNGAEFLAQARLIAPDTVRVLLTGHASLEGAIAAVNQGSIFRFVTKPCPAPDLRRVLDDAVEQARLITADRLLVQQKLDQITSHLLRVERLATLGTMASAVGHELNNALMVFEGAAALIEQEIAEHRRPSAGLKALRQTQALLAVHARNLLNLGRPPRDSATTTDLREAVAGVLEVLRSSGALRCAVMRLDLGTAPALVTMRRSEIEQILVNLIKNAVDALDESSQAEPVVEVRITTATEAGTATCAVSDNGRGIAASALPLLFEAYYTTKPPERGTGLGLFVVRQIAQAAGGEVAVESEEGNGTTITVVLPLAEGDGRVRVA